MSDDQAPGNRNSADQDLNDLLEALENLSHSVGKSRARQNEMGAIEIDAAMHTADDGLLPAA